MINIVTQSRETFTSSVRFDRVRSVADIHFRERAKVIKYLLLAIVVSH